MPENDRVAGGADRGEGEFAADVLAEVEAQAPRRASFDRDGGELLIFRESERGMTLQGESACRPAE